MLIPGYAPTATERVLPKMALDFTTASLDARVTITRALNTATRINSSGFVETINANLPRFDYRSGVCQGLLIEESRINLMTYSETFTNAIYVKQRASIDPTPVTSPANTLTAYKIVEDTTASNTHRIFQTVTTIATAYTLSVFAKPAGRDFVYLGIVNSTGATRNAFFNVATGAIGTLGAGITATITALANGWYRCTATIDAAFAGSNSLIIGVAPANNTPSYTGDGVSGINVYGADVQLGGFPTSYIPNLATGTTTRNADVAVMTGTNFSSWWQATTGSASVRASQISVVSIAPWLQFDDTTANNIIALRGNSANPELYIKATTDQAQIDAGTIAANTQYNLSGAWNTDNCAAAINGAAAVTDASATIPTVTQARLGSDGTNYLNGWLQSILYWPQRITNAEVQAFSKL